LDVSPDQIAECAVAAMLIELSSSPKPGNVDRCHDFEDITFQHFLTSAVSSFSAFRRAAAGEGRFGQLILDASNSRGFWNLPGNTHFGSLVLMLPLCIAAGRCRNDIGLLKEELTKAIEESSVEDACDFFLAFELAGARVADVSEFSLKCCDWREKLHSEKKTLLDLMNLSIGHDLIAKEWSTGYEKTFQLANWLEDEIKSAGLVRGVVKTYLRALSVEPDSLVLAKFGEKKASEVSLRAKQALDDESLTGAMRLDQELLEEDVNPGSTADLIGASLLICLLRGLRF
jgi:triphosphoribosyl-dephospho-CoA synthase